MLNIHEVEVRALVVHRISTLIPIADDELIIAAESVLLVLLGETKGFHSAMLPVCFHDSNTLAGGTVTNSVTGL